LISAWFLDVPRLKAVEDGIQGQEHYEVFSNNIHNLGYAGSRHTGLGTSPILKSLKKFQDGDLVSSNIRSQPDFLPKRRHNRSFDRYHCADLL